HGRLVAVRFLGADRRHTAAVDRSVRGGHETVLVFQLPSSNYERSSPAFAASIGPPKGQSPPRPRDGAADCNAGRGPGGPSAGVAGGSRRKRAAAEATSRTGPGSRAARIDRN